MDIKATMDIWKEVIYLREEVVRTNYDDDYSKVINAYFKNYKIGDGIFKIKDENGDTPLILAQRANKTRLVTFIAEVGLGIPAPTEKLFIDQVKDFASRVLKTQEKTLHPELKKGLTWVYHAVNVDYPNGIDIFAADYGRLKTSNSLLGSLCLMKSKLLHRNVHFFKNQINSQNNLGKTALMIVAIKGDFYLAQEIINNGADLALKNKLGKTALDIARETAGAEQIFALLEQKMNINASAKALSNTNSSSSSSSTIIQPKQSLSKEGFIAEIQAAISKESERYDSEVNKREATKQLITYMSNAFNVDHPGKDVFAADYTRFNSYSLFEVLAMAKPSLLSKNSHFFQNQIDLQNDDGNTVLMIAIKNKKFNLAQEIINNGADLTLKNKEGKTAVDVAKETDGAAKVTALLLQKTVSSISAGMSLDDSSSAGSFSAKLKRKRANDANTVAQDYDSDFEIIENPNFKKPIVFDLTDDSSSSSSSSNNWQNRVQNQKDSSKGNAK